MYGNRRRVSVVPASWIDLICREFDVESVDGQSEIDQNADADDAEEDEEESGQHPADDKQAEEEEHGECADDHPRQQQQRETIAGAED